MLSHHNKLLSNGRPTTNRMSSSVRGSLSSSLIDRVEKAPPSRTHKTWLTRSERERIEHEQYKCRITELERLLKDMEMECKECKETVEYVQLEASVQADFIQELEQTISNEKAAHRSDLDKLSELKAYCGELLAQNKEKDETLAKLSAKFQRNRDVFLENERKAQDEINKLDQLLDRVVSVLSEGADPIQKKRLLDDLTASGRVGDTNRTQTIEAVNPNNKELKDDHNNHLGQPTINTN